MKCFLVLFAVAAVAVAYPGGAPESTCGDMLPQHGPPAQNSASPYLIKLSKSAIRSGEKVYVTLEAPSGSSFKGFLMVARVGQTAVGKFDNAAGVKMINCGNGVGTGATHLDANAKTKVTVAWTAPPGLSEKVTFFVTTVRDGSTYWVAQKSSVLSVNK